MFSWFLKLLGIEEDKPVSSNNSFLASNANKTNDTKPAEAALAAKKESPKESEVKSEEAVAKKEPAAKEEPVKEEPAASKKEESSDTSARPEQKPAAKLKSAAKPKPAAKPKSKPAPKPEPKAEAKSLADEIPGLKANYVKVLEEAGFTNKAAIDKADDKELLALKGIGKATLKVIRG